MKALRAYCICLVFVITLWACLAHSGWTPPVKIIDERISLGKALVADSGGIHQGLPVLTDEEGRPFSQIGQYILYQNPDAMGEVQIHHENYWPMLTDWGEEIYVTDTTIAVYLDPRIGISDSVLHVFAEGNFHPHHYVSYNDGVGWQFFADYFDSALNIPAGIINLYCEDNRLYTTWWGRRGHEDAFIYFRASDDYGETWPISAELLQDPWHWRWARYGNVAGHGDTVFVSFREDSITCWRSTDMGVTWESPGYITNDHSGYPPSIAYAAGVVSIAYNLSSGGQLDVFYIRSTDHGVSWTEPLFIGFQDGITAQWPEVAADSLGNIAICWMDYLGTPHSWTGGIWVRISHDYGETWEEAVRLDSDYKGMAGTSVVIDGNYVGVAWASSGGFDNGRLHYRESWDNGMSWREDQIISEGWCQVPRVAKHGNSIHLVWNKYEWNSEDHDWLFIKYIRYDGLTGAEPPQGDIFIPFEYDLRAYPNPFNSVTTLTLDSVEGGDFEIKIFNVTGALVQTLKTRGEKATWDATDSSGRKVSSGIYFARTGGAINYSTMKLIYLR